MILYFDPVTLDLGHVVYAYGDDYDPASNGDHHVVLPRGTGLPIESIFLARDAAGEVAVQVKREARIVMPQPAMSLGDVARFAAVPLGMAVTVNGVAQGTMDDPSGVLEVSPTTSGLFAFLFAKPGWTDTHFALEVRPPAEVTA